LDCINQAIHEAEALEERQWLLGLRYKRTFILLTQGNFSEASAEAEVLLGEAERRNRVTGKLAALEIRGLTNLEAGNVGVARQIADEMKMEIEGWLNPKLMRRWHDFAGQIELAEENIGSALDHFEQVIPLLPHQYEPNGDAHGWYYNSLAYAYYLSGDLDMAQQWYESILALTTGRLGTGVTYAKSHFMLGQIYERRGMNAEAIQMYRAFLDLWRDADLDTPELEEAKRALANLSN
jgi:tetratricopeptide (TPR) repeat protein